MMDIRLSATWNTLAYVFVSLVSGFLAIILQVAVNSSPTSNIIQLIFGIIFVVIGSYIRFTAIRQFNKEALNFSPRMKPQHFFSSGTYSQSRNPMYLGIVLMYVGSTFMFGSWLMAIFTIIVFALLNHRASNEERLMKVRFKEYVKYEKNVRKWL